MLLVTLLVDELFAVHQKAELYLMDEETATMLASIPRV